MQYQKTYLKDKEKNPYLEDKEKRKTEIKTELKRYFVEYDDQDMNLTCQLMGLREERLDLLRNLGKNYAETEILQEVVSDLYEENERKRRV